MFNRERRKDGQYRIVLDAIGQCVTIALLIVLISTRPAMAQVKTATAKCDQGRAMSLGVNVSSYGDMATSGPMLTALEQSGVGWTRTYIQWGWIERKPGVYDWRTVDADIDREAGMAHLDVLAVIMGPTPCWSLEYPEKNCTRPRHTLPKKEDWTKFVSTVVSRYKDRVHYWEIWNEPNHAQFIDVPELDQRLNGYREQILIPGAEAVHAADPSAKVVAPALGASLLSKEELSDDFRLAMKAPAAQLVDVVSYHTYFPAGDIDEKAIEIRNAMQSLGIGNKPLWLTETGIILGPVRLAVTSTAALESEQANYLQTGVADVLASGNVQKVFWYDLTDGHDSPNFHNSIYHFGLVDVTGPQFKSRPAFTALQHLAENACH
ncbi:MAG: glycosyl hydrolase [Acidobacteriaceae bacterium]